MAPLDTVVFAGLSGRQYTFEVYPLDTQFNPVGAVYDVLHQYWKQDANRWYYVPLYFGQTRDLSTRFEGHHREECFRRNHANCIGIHRDDNEASRLAKETDLRLKWNPTCNRQ